MKRTKTVDIVSKIKEINMKVTGFLKKKVVKHTDESLESPSHIKKKRIVGFKDESSDSDKSIGSPVSPAKFKGLKKAGTIRINRNTDENSPNLCTPDDDDDLEWERIERIHKKKEQEAKKKNKIMPL